MGWEAPVSRMGCNCMSGPGDGWRCCFTIRPNAANSIQRLGALEVDLAASSSAILAHDVRSWVEEFLRANARDF
jgi:hypothetical protein